mgnify:CR=1 FL=1
MKTLEEIIREEVNKVINEDDDQDELIAVRAHKISREMIASFSPPVVMNSEAKLAMEYMFVNLVKLFYYSKRGMPTSSLVKISRVLTNEIELLKKVR